MSHFDMTRLFSGWMIIALTGLCIVCATATAQEDGWTRRVTPSHDTNYEPSTEFETPHIPYAKPYASGAINALFIVWAPSGRHVVELHQRMDMQFEYVGVGSNNMSWRASWQNPVNTVFSDGMERAAALVNNDHDVIVIGSLPWSEFPEELRAEILRRVNEGTGLIYSHRTWPSEADGALFEVFQGAQNSDNDFPPGNFRVAQYGEGRVAFLHNPMVNIIDNFYSDFTGFYEREVEQFARAMLWAAQREPQVRFASVNNVRQAAVEGGDATLTINNALAEAVRGELRIDIRRDLDRQYPTLYGGLFYQLRPYDSWEDIYSHAELYELEAETAETMSVAIPRLASGNYSLDVSLRDEDGRVISWRNFPVEMEQPTGIDSVSVSGADMDSVDFDDDAPAVWLAREDTADFNVSLHGNPEGVVRMTLMERDGRIIAISESPVNDPAISLPLNASKRMLVIAKAELLSDGAIIAEQRIPLLIKPEPEERPALAQRAMGCTLVRPDDSSLDISYFPGYNLPREYGILFHAWHDVQVHNFLGFPSLLEIPGITEDFERDPSLFDPEYRGTAAQRARDSVRPSTMPGAPGEPLFICDEWTWGYVGDAGGNRLVPWPDAANQDRSPHALAAFRRYLMDIYDGLNELNAEWGTDFEAWDDVMPYLHSDDYTEIPDEKHWPRIVDYMQFVYTGLAEYAGELSEAVKEENPDNFIATSGHYTNGMFTGMDYYQWTRNIPYIVPYYDPHVWRSFMDTPIAVWRAYGGTVHDEVTENLRAWTSLFQEVENSFWSREHPHMKPDFTFKEATEGYFSALREIREKGLDELLDGTENLQQIGILYHSASEVVYELNDWRHRGAGYYRDIHRRKKYVSYLGKYLEVLFPVWEWRFVHLDQFENDDFAGKPRPRVLILPMTEPLSDAEADIIRDYVREGGIVIADVNAGSRNQHGSLRETGALDDLFGIERTGYQPPVHNPPINLRPFLHGQQSVDALFPHKRPSGGDYIEGRDGKAIALNGRNQYIHVPHSPELEPTSYTLEAWVKGDGAIPNGTIISKNGNWRRDGYYSIAVAEGNAAAVLNIGGTVHDIRSEENPITDDQWHHIAATYDDAVLRLYLDGQPAAEKTINRQRTPQLDQPDPSNMLTGHMTQNVQPDSLAIGRTQFVGDNYGGLLDETLFYSRSLTADEIAARAAGGNPPEGVIAHWSFNEDTHAAVRDVSGNSHHGAFADFNIVPPTPIHAVRFEDGQFSYTPVTGGDTIRPNGARALAVVENDGEPYPAFLVNEYGDGLAIYLNFAPWDEVAAECIRMATGLQLDWRLEQPQYPTIDYVREYRSGGHRYFGAAGNPNAGWPWSNPDTLGHLQEGTPSTVTLPETMHIYNSRTSEYLGQRANFDIVLSPENMGAIFAALPYPVEGVGINLDEAAAAGEIARFNVSVAPEAARNETHVLRYRLIDPAGAEAKVYRGVARTDDNGIAAIEIPFALNDPAGAWRIVVTDIASGVEAEAIFELHNLE